MSEDNFLERLMDPATWRPLIDAWNKFESVYGRGHFRIGEMELLGDFLQTVSHEEDLVAVLRGHLMVDVQLNDLLAQRLGGSDVLAFVAFQDKVTLTKRHELVPKDFRKLLLAVNDLRNSFAHPPIKKTLTDDDVAALYKAVPTDFRNVLFEYHGADARPGDKVRAILGFTFSWLHGQVDATKTRPEPPPNFLRAQSMPSMNAANPTTP